VCSGTGKDSELECCCGCGTGTVREPRSGTSPLEAGTRGLVSDSRPKSSIGSTIGSGIYMPNQSFWKERMGGGGGRRPFCVRHLGKMGILCKNITLVNTDVPSTSE
jgi:hypothetical protein